MIAKEGEKFSHYKILSKIGSGGMGDVYLAEGTKLDRKVAIKFLNQQYSKDAEKLKRFVQEAKATSTLNHQDPRLMTVEALFRLRSAQHGDWKIRHRQKPALQTVKPDHLNRTDQLGHFIFALPDPHWSQRPVRPYCPKL